MLWWPAGSCKLLRETWNFIVPPLDSSPLALLWVVLAALVVLDDWCMLVVMNKGSGATAAYTSPEETFGQMGFPCERKCVIGFIDSVCQKRSVPLWHRQLSMVSFLQFAFSRPTLLGSGLFVCVSL